MPVAINSSCAVSVYFFFVVVCFRILMCTLYPPISPLRRICQWQLILAVRSLSVFLFLFFRILMCTHFFFTQNMPVAINSSCAVSVYFLFSYTDVHSISIHFSFMQNMPVTILAVQSLFIHFFSYTAVSSDITLCG